MDKDLARIWQDISNIDRLKIDAGEIPPETCPIIDEAYKKIDDINWRIGRAKKELNSNGVIEELNIDECDAEIELEEIREHNAQLRELSRFWYDQFKTVVNFVNTSL